MMIGHSFLVGLALMTFAFLGIRSQSEPEYDPREAIVQSAQVLLICIGMTAVMILINDNLARALAVGATIALIRFRVKVDKGGFSMAVFYGVIAGTACGVNQRKLAWVICICFGALQGVLRLGITWIARARPARPALECEEGGAP